MKAQVTLLAAGLVLWASPRAGHTQPAEEPLVFKEGGPRGGLTSGCRDLLNANFKGSGYQWIGHKIISVSPGGPPAWTSIEGWPQPGANVLMTCGSLASGSSFGTTQSRGPKRPGATIPAVRLGGITLGWVGDVNLATNGLFESSWATGFGQTRTQQAQHFVQVEAASGTSVGSGFQVLCEKQESPITANAQTTYRTIACIDVQVDEPTPAVANLPPDPLIEVPPYTTTVYVEPGDQLTFPLRHGVRRSFGGGSSTYDLVSIVSSGAGTRLRWNGSNMRSVSSYGGVSVGTNGVSAIYVRSFSYDQLHSGRIRAQAPECLTSRVKVEAYIGLNGQLYQGDWVSEDWDRKPDAADLEIEEGWPAQIGSAVWWDGPGTVDYVARFPTTVPGGSTTIEEIIAVVTDFEQTISTSIDDPSLFAEVSSNRSPTSLAGCTPGGRSRTPRGDVGLTFTAPSLANLPTSCTPTPDNRFFECRAVMTVESRGRKAPGGPVELETIRVGLKADVFQTNTMRVERVLPNGQVVSLGTAADGRSIDLGRVPVAEGVSYGSPPASCAGRPSVRLRLTNIDPLFTAPAPFYIRYPEGNPWHNATDALGNVYTGHPSHDADLFVEGGPGYTPSVGAQNSLDVDVCVVTTEPGQGRGSLEITHESRSFHKDVEVVTIAYEAVTPFRLDAVAASHPPGQGPGSVQTDIAAGAELDLGVHGIIPTPGFDPEIGVFEITNPATSSDLEVSVAHYWSGYADTAGDGDIVARAPSTWSSPRQKIELRPGDSARFAMNRLLLSGEYRGRVAIFYRTKINGVYGDFESVVYPSRVQMSGLPYRLDRLVTSHPPGEGPPPGAAFQDIVEGMTIDFGTDALSTSGSIGTFEVSNPLSADLEMGFMTYWNGNSSAVGNGGLRQIPTPGLYANFSTQVPAGGTVRFEVEPVQSVGSSTGVLAIWHRIRHSSGLSNLVWTEIPLELIVIP